MSSELQTVANLINRLVLEQNRLKAYTEGAEISNEFGEAFVSKKVWNHSGRMNSSQSGTRNMNAGCFFCGGKDHMKRDCAERKRMEGKCLNCGKSGHMKKDCRKKKNEKTEKSFAMIDDSNSGNTAFDSGWAGFESEDRNEWYLDSGASQHMSCHLVWFDEYKELDEKSNIKIGNGELIQAVGVGSIKILAFDGVNWNKRIIGDVLYVPRLCTNLFSQSRVLDNNFSLVSDKNEVKFKEGERVAAIAIRKGGLFRMLFKMEQSETQSFWVAKVMTLKEWHERLGHQNSNYVRNFLKKNQVKFVNEEYECEACVYGKMHRLVFPRSESRAKECGDLVHADVWGPTRTESIGGSRFFLLLKDDFSCFRRVYFMEKKSEVYDHFMNFLHWAEKQSGRMIKILRSDGAGEFTGRKMKEFLDLNGIVHQRSVPYTPEQNGRIERDMRTVVEAARTMLHAKNLNLNLCAEAVNLAVYVLNRTGVSSMQSKTKNMNCGFVEQLIFVT